jgi:ubiquinone/menaquinone biosynthesis C-methylase UbiE
MDPKTMWGAGDYPAVAELISDVGELCVEQAGIGAGMDVLDVACGSGNATIPAARAGANVTGLDFQPDLLANARQRAQDEGIDVEWIEADAQQMPFDDQRFDRVISTFRPHVRARPRPHGLGDAPRPAPRRSDRHLLLDA